ncbi:hypothetical protein K788_0003552 [Paraburkholderia caribensis MBA4]|uniref:Uncharacterized protein n=1 Tax=Paraburkholderia caribensis MBA4 TaxID=1323664 RepID=A0A0P0R676_9BURK|nr:hypothetical protein K788_0003552 [Paraburkholderia caribensis MBA4]
MEEVDSVSAFLIDRTRCTGRATCVTPIAHMVCAVDHTQ